MSLSSTLPFPFLRSFYCSCICSHAFHFEYFSFDSYFYSYLLGKPAIAFSSFQYALHVRYNEPFIWLRLGECCILNYLKVDNTEKKQKHASFRSHDNINHNINPDIVIEDLITAKRSGRICLPSSQTILKKNFPKVPFLCRSLVFFNKFSV